MAWLQSLSLLQQGALGVMVVCAVAYLWMNRASIAATFGKIKADVTPAPPPVVAVDDDTADFQALGRLQKRFIRLKCPEGQAGVQTCLTHFYHGTEGQP